jgi:hypothetical protein
MPVQAYTQVLVVAVLVEQVVRHQVALHQDEAALE